MQLSYNAMAGAASAGDAERRWILEVVLPNALPGDASQLQAELAPLQQYMSCDESAALPWVCSAYMP